MSDGAITHFVKSNQFFRLQAVKLSSLERNHRVYKSQRESFHLRFSQWWLWVLSSGIWRRVVRWKSTDVSEEHVASNLQGWRIRINQEINQREAGGKQRCLYYTSTLKIKATSFSETSEDSQRTIRLFISEDRTLQNRFSFWNYCNK
jgi:hypothetical protein